MYRLIENVSVLYYGSRRSRSSFLSTVRIISILFAFLLSSYSSKIFCQATTTNVSSNNNPACLNSSVSLTANISPVVTSGTVTFFDNGNPLGAPVNVVSGAATLAISNLSAGTHPITAVYSGDGTFTSSTGSLTQSITAIPTASIDYADPYCKSQTTLQPVIISGTGSYTGGSYSFTPSGLDVNAFSGTINPNASVPGTYTVTYVIPGTGGCSAIPVSTTVTINASPTASISYAGPFCRSIASLQSVILTGTGTYSGGTFSSSPTGLSLDPASGSITPQSSDPGTYTITYSIPASGGCAALSVTTTLSITGPKASINYAGPFCKSVATAQPVTITGTGSYTGGTYSSAPAGLTINPTTGAITPNSSSAGTYTVTYTIPASGSCGVITTTTSVTVTNPPSASISYSGSPFCTSIAGQRSPTLTGTPGGTYSSTPGLTIDANSGAITPSTSSGGTYLITYTIPASGGCAAFNTTTSITITALPTPTISYSGTPFCKTVSTAQPVTLAGPAGGTYSSTAGLTINAGTGQITPGTSSAGTYTVTYTLAPSAGCGVVTTTTLVTITALPTASLSYTGSPFCTSIAGTIPVNLTGTSGGIYSSTPGLTLNATTGAITPATSTGGSYRITYTIAAAGCAVVRATSTVIIKTLPIASFTYPGTPYCKTGTNPVPTFSIGGSAGTFSSAPAGLNFVGATTGEINLATTAGGTYIITNTIPASGGCGIVTASSTITITNPPVATFNYPASSYCSGSANPLPVFSGGGVAGTFSSTAGLVFVNTSTGQLNLAASTPGTYTVTNSLPAANGCGIITATTTISINPLPSVSISANYCTGGGTVRLTAKPVPAGAYTYLWNHGETTQSIDIDIAGNYTVTVTNSNGCKATSTITISQELAVNGDFSLGNVGFHSAYTNNPSSPMGLWTEGYYAVGNNANAYHPNFWGYDHTMATPGLGNYLIVNGSPPPDGKIVWEQGPVTVKPNTTYYFSAWAKSLNDEGPFAELQFNVNTGGGYIAIGTTAVLPPGVANSSNAGWVRFYGVWNSGSSTSATLSILDLQTAADGNDFGLDDISISTLAPVPFTTDPIAVGEGSGGVICAEGSLTLFANIGGGTSPINYSWTGPNGFTSNTANPTVTSNSSALNNGKYNVTVTDFYGCPITGDVDVTVKPLPAVGDQTITICSGGSFSLLPSGATIPSGTTYTWTSPTGSGFTGGASQSVGQFSITGSLINTTADPVTATYFVTPVAGGCDGHPFKLTVQVNPKPNVANQVLSVCSGSSFMIQSTGVPAGTTYTWTTPVVVPIMAITGGTAQATGQPFFSQTLSNTTTGAATATYTITPLSGSCAGNAFSARVTVNPISPTPTITIIQPTCAIPSGTITIKTPLGSGYEYSLDGVPFQSSAVFNGLVPGSHTVNSRHSSNINCVSTPLTFSINSLPAAPEPPVLTVTKQPTCALPTGTIVVSAPIGSNWDYSIDGSTFQSSPTFSLVTPGNHSIRVRSKTDITCISNPASISIQAIPVAPAKPVVTVSVQPNCSVSTGTVVISSPLGPDFEYSIDGGVFQLSPTYTGINPGVHNIIVRSTLDVSCVSAASQVTVNPMPAVLSISESHRNALCNGGASGSITLFVSGGVAPYSYIWSNGAITKDITGLVASTYTVVVTDFTGCTITKTIVITEPSPISLTETHIDAKCNGGGTGSINLSVSGSTAPFTYTWSNGSVSQDISGIIAGNYHVRVRDVNGCEADMDVAIAEPNSIVIEETHTPIFCKGEKSSVTINASGGTAPYTGSGTFDQSAGTTIYTVTDAQGCSKTFSVSVTEPSPLLVTEVHSAIVCNGGTSNVTIIATGGTPPYEGTGNYNQSSGRVIYTVRDANGCSKDISVTLVEPVVLSVTETHTPIYCSGGSSFVTISANGGTAPYTGTGIFSQAAGTMAYTVSDANGCSETITIELSEPAPISVSEIHTPILCSGGNSILTIDADGGTAPYTGTGDHTVTAGSSNYLITDANGCTATILITINEPSPLTVSESHTHILCHGGNSTVTIQASGGTGSYTGIGEFSQSAGTTVYTVSDENGCESTIAVTVIEPPAITATLSIVDVLCSGELTGSVVIQPSGGVGSYTINRPETGLGAGTHDFIITDANGCSSNLSVTITEPPPVTAVISGSTTICEGSPTTISVALTGNAPWSIEYTDGVTPVTVNNITSSPFSFSVVPTSNATYTLLSVNDANCVGTVNGSVDIVVNPMVSPIFTPIGPLCQNSPAPDLALTSDNGITGTWNPAVIDLNNAGISTYTFTPTLGQCAQTATMEVIIKPITYTTTRVTICSSQLPYNWNGNPYDQEGTYTATLTNSQGCDSIATLNLFIVSEGIPVFTSIGPLCQNSTPPLLLTLSNNGFTGTWNPSIVNTSVIGTTRYKFTPAGSCTRTIYMDIEITDQVIPTFSPIGPFCQNSTAPSLPVVSDNGISGNWSPSAINTSVSGEAVYTFTPDGNQCSAMAQIRIFINPLLNTTIDSAVCANALPFDWNGQTITGAGTYTFTTASSFGCDSTTTLNLSVNSVISKVIDSTVCANALPFDWNGQTITGAGTYTFTTASSLGCDSTTTLNLSVNSVISKVIDSTFVQTHCHSTGMVKLSQELEHIHSLLPVRWDAIRRQR